MSKAKAPRVFVPLTKVDEEQRLVYGTITQEVVDQSGEVMDYDTSKPNFEKWSNDIHTASGGLSKGNLRVMHGLTVAGKLTDLAFNDDDKSIEVCSKVVDDSEWNKVLEGCYTGFSVGGKYGKRWNETVDGEVIKKYTAVPNEVSLVDNPCVQSATFSLVKAEGVVEEVMFKVNAENQADPGDETPEPTETPAADTTTSVEPSNEDVAKCATALAKAANDGTTWIDHIEAARNELMKADTALSVAAAAEKESEAPNGNEGAEAEAEPAAEDAGEEEPAAEGDPVEKVTPSGVKQTWQASDGSTFDKKADAVAHEETLTKAAVEPTEADKLRARLEKATKGPEENDEQAELPLFEDFDRMSKVVAAISTPFEDGAPKLEKGMYTINRFSNVLSDMASLSKSIKRESIKEDGDGEDSAIAADIIAAVKTLGKSFIDYATDQVTELLAGMDDGVLVECYDYYYCAAKEDGDNALAKDICETINTLREPAAEARDTLAKAFGVVVGTVEVTDELSPPMQKRFDALEAENADLKKVAGDAIEKVEELAKRVEQIADQPLPRAPTTGSVAIKEGDFLGKYHGASTDEERVAIVHDMVKTMGPDAMATMMIKASQAGGGQQLHLSR